MDYLKLDADLLSAYGDASGADCGEDRLEVWVYTSSPPTEEQVAILRRFGVRNILPGRRVFSATLTIDGLAKLSEQYWVEALTSAKVLFPAERRQAGG